MAERDRQRVDPLEVVDHKHERLGERGDCPMRGLEHTQWIKRFKPGRCEETASPRAPLRTTPRSASSSMARPTKAPGTPWSLLPSRGSEEGVPR